MKIQLIGTGSIGAKERSACTLIDGRVLVDLGNGNTKAIKYFGNDLFDICAILITHLHGDHFLDMPFFMLTRSIWTDRIKEKLTIYGPKKLESNSKKLMKICNFGDFNKIKNKAHINFKEFSELKNENVKGYTINSYIVDHGKTKPSFGYIVEKDGKKVGFSGDSIYCEAIDDIVSKSDVSILDMAKIEGHSNHMGIDNILMLCEKYPDKKIIATHMQGDSRKEAVKLNVENLIIPEDGDVFEI